MHTSARRRIVRVAIGVLVLSGAAASPANAAAPPNDSILTPTVVSRVPVMFTQDTSGARASRTDGACVQGSSVWYRFVPQATRRLRVVTVGSDYDTVLAVFRGPRATRTLVGCSDDALDDGTSAVALRFVAGQSYWIAVSACCSNSARGGVAHLRMYAPAPAGAQTTITGVESGGVSGRLFVSGRTTCRTPSLAFPLVFVSQRVGDLVARGTVEGMVPECTAAPSTWRIAVDSETAAAFQPGSISLTLTDQVEDGFAFVTGQPQTMILTAVDNPDARAATRAR